AGGGRRRGRSGRRPPPRARQTSAGIPRRRGPVRRQREPRPAPRPPVELTRARPLIAALLLLAAPPIAAQRPSYDVVIHGGKVVDGSGAPWYWGDVAIKDGKIAAIGRIDPTLGKRAIDATGLVVVPGFFDMMGQTAAPFLKDPNAAFNLLSQGITTLNAGEGESDAPLDGK